MHQINRLFEIFEFIRFYQHEVQHILVVYIKLSAAIGWQEMTENCQDDILLQEQADLCNERKTQAKTAGEEGCNIYLWSMIKNITKDSEFIMTGVVTRLVEHGMDVLIFEAGTSVMLVENYILSKKSEIHFEHLGGFFRNACTITASWYLETP